MDLSRRHLNTLLAGVSLAGALSLDAIGTYARQATGQKFLIRPSLP
jgi:hypothetical protein